MHLEGNAKVSLIILDNDTADVENRVIDIVVNEEYTLEDITNNTKVNVMLVVDRANIVQNGSDLEITLRLDANINLEDLVSLNIVDKINDNKLVITDLDSMNIYVVKPKDTLWSIAKKYKTSIEKIVKTNEILNPEKIDIGQKILIIR
ncbi:LysM domain protein [compost metagenome]